MGYSTAHFNLTNVSFVPLFVELGIEFGQFEEAERGGLLSTFTAYDGVIQNKYSALSFIACCTENYDERVRNTAEHFIRADEVCLEVLNRFKERKQSLQERRYPRARSA